MAELVQNKYANSLFEVALENHVQDNIYNELISLHDIFTENLDYLKIFSAPVLGRDVKQTLLSEAFENSLSVFTLNFLKLLVDNERFSLIFSIIEEYKRLYNSHYGIIEITAITATTLSDHLKEKLIAKLGSVTQKKVRLNTVVDSSILGGIKLTFHQTEIDATVKSQLDELRKSIIQTTI